MYQHLLAAAEQSVLQATNPTPWWADLGSWGNIASIIGAIFGILGLIGVFVAVWQLYLAKRERRIAMLKEDFGHVCRSPAKEIEDYPKVYERTVTRPLARRHPELAKQGFGLIDHAYFSKRLPADWVRPDGASYDFPLVYTDNWTRSANPKFIVSTKYLQQEDEPPEDREPERQLIEKADRFLRTFRMRMDDYPAFLSALGRRVWDDPTFDLNSADYQNNELVLKCRRGQYFSFVKTYELMLRELYFHLYAEKKNRRKDGFKGLLPTPCMLRDSVQLDTLLRQSGFQPPIGAKLGFQVFVIMRADRDRHITFIQERGREQLEYPDLYHVAPAGTFAPMCTWEGKLKGQCTLSYTVIREFLEEIYDLEKADRHKSYRPFEILSLSVKDDENSVKRIPGKYLGLENPDRMREIPAQNHKYEIIPTGFLFDLIAMKPALTLVLYVKDPALYNETYKSFEANWEGPCKPFEIESGELKEFVRNCLNTRQFLPAGAVAVAEGMHYFKNEIRKEVK